MLGSLTFLTYAAVHLAFLYLAYRLWQARPRLYLLFLCAIIGALAYDNLIIGLGRFVGEGSLLRALNVPRYVLHALLTPTMLLVGLQLARNAGVGWAWQPRRARIFVAFTLLLIAVGVYFDIVRLRLAPESDFGTLRYVNDAAVGPPIAAILTVLGLIAFGVAVWRLHRWASWLLVGSTVMFLASAAGSALGLLTNIGEIALVAGMVLTARRFPAITYDDFLSAQRQPLTSDSATSGVG